MSSQPDKTYDTGIAPVEDLMCVACNQLLTPQPITLSYMNAAFPVELPACPVCGMVYIPEELAAGRILHVEKSLEDK